MHIKRLIFYIPNASHINHKPKIKKKECQNTKTSLNKNGYTGKKGKEAHILFVSLSPGDFAHRLGKLEKEA